MVHFCQVFTPLFHPSIHPSTEPFKSAPTATANKTAMAEKLCLQWKDFTESVKTAFGNLKEDADFTDVTLFCEDVNQISGYGGFKSDLAEGAKEKPPPSADDLHARFEVRSSFSYD